MNRVKRSAVVMVGIRQDVRDKLYDVINKMRPTPVIADVVSLAVERYLDEQERDQ